MLWISFCQASPTLKPKPEKDMTETKNYRPVPLMNIDAIIFAAAKLLRSCPTLCDPIDGSPPGSPVPGILQARTLEWVAISFSSAWKWKVKVKSFSRARLLATPWTAAYQAPPSMGFSRQEYWSGVPLYGNVKWCCHYGKQYGISSKISTITIWSNSSTPRSIPKRTETGTQTNICTPMFVPSLFMMAK